MATTYLLPKTEELPLVRKYANVLIDRWFKRTFGWAGGRRLMQLLLQEMIPERVITDLHFGPQEHQSDTVGEGHPAGCTLYGSGWKPFRSGSPKGWPKHFLRTCGFQFFFRHSVSASRRAYRLGILSNLLYRHHELFISQGFRWSSFQVQSKGAH